MVPLALLAFLMLGTVTVQHGIVVVQHGHWRAIDIDVPAARTQIRCEFRVPEESSSIEAVLVTRDEAQKFSEGKSFQRLASTGFAHDGTLRYIADSPGLYVLLLDNRIEGRRPTEVSLRIDLIKPGETYVRTIPAGRRHAVVLASVLFFLGVVAYSARKLMR